MGKSEVILIEVLGGRVGVFCLGLVKSRGGRTLHFTCGSCFDSLFARREPERLCILTPLTAKTLKQRE